MAAQTTPEATQPRRASLANGQAAASKALGIPIVHVEAVDQDGNKVVEKVESEIALLWPFVHKEVVTGKHGKTPEDPVQLPKQVAQDILALLLEYCRYHRFPGRSDKERKIFDEKFIRLDTRRLCELTSAADSLDMRPLVDLSSRALARMIEGKSPDEIRETFHLPDDLTEEEKLEPVKNVADDPRIRLLNRLYAKKRKELAEKKAELQRREAGVKCVTPSNEETRTVEELLSFIEEERQGQGKKPAKRKKAKKKKDISGEQALASARSSESKQSDKGAPFVSPPSPNSPGSLNRGESLSQEGFGWPECDDVDDADLDDEIEAFERSLRADWEDRRAELIFMAGAYPSKTKVTTSATKKADMNGKRDSPPEPRTPQNSSPVAAVALTKQPLPLNGEKPAESPCAVLQESPTNMQHLNGHASPPEEDQGSAAQDSTLPQEAILPPKPEMAAVHPSEGSPGPPESVKERLEQDKPILSLSTEPEISQAGTVESMLPEKPALRTVLPEEENAQKQKLAQTQSPHQHQHLPERDKDLDAIASSYPDGKAALSIQNGIHNPEEASKLPQADSDSCSLGGKDVQEVALTPLRADTVIDAQPVRLPERGFEGSEDSRSDSYRKGSNLTFLAERPSAAKAEHGDSGAAPSPEAIIEMLQDFCKQIGFGEVISIGRKGHHGTWTHVEKDAEVLLEQSLPRLGLLRLQRTPDPKAASRRFNFE